MRIRRVFAPLFCLLAFGAAAQLPTQVNLLNQKKLKVYKADIKDFTQEGTRGLSVLFSVEYGLTEDEFKATADRGGKNYFTFWVSVFDKNNEPAYDAYAFASYRRNQPGAGPFHTTIAFGSTPPRRSTNVELFIPYAQLDLPEGPSDLKVLFSAHAGNADAPGKRFDNFHLQAATLTKPPLYWVKLTPKQLLLGAQKTVVTQLAEDFAVARGSDKALADVLTYAPGVVGTATAFVYSEGDATQLRTQPQRGTTGQLANKARPMMTAAGQVLPAAPAALSVTWPVDLKAATVLALKNPALDASFAVEKTRQPAVRVSGVKVNRFVRFEGASGGSVSFAYEAKTTVDLVALLAYSAADDERAAFVPLRSLRVMSGAATTDSTGRVTLGKSAGGKVELFFPYAGFLLADESTRKAAPKRFRLAVGVATDAPPLRPDVNQLTQRTVRQPLEINVLKDAVVNNPVVKPGVVYKNTRGLRIDIPYVMPAAYADLLKGSFAIQLTEVLEKNEPSRFMGFLAKTTLVNDSVRKAPPGTDRSGVSQTYLTSRATGSIALFMPYATLALTENATPMRFSANLTARRTNGAPLEVGTIATALKLGLDEKKLRFLTVGVSRVQFKEAGAPIVWRIRSTDGTIYQSDPLPTAKKMESFYAHNYCAAADDRISIEVLQGNDPQSLQSLAKWEMAVKDLKPADTVEIAKEGEGNLRGIAITYKVN